ncbi:MAG: thiamine phosphate synthase [Rhodobacteraceae bacterium]|nr:thiamine phosphate synthase [Paracoccaceae bacterium]
MNRPRIFLVTPPDLDADALAPKLKDALQGGDIACVLIYTPQTNSRDLQEAAKSLVPLIQESEAAALIYNDTQVAGRSGADGAHVDSSLEDVKLAVESLQPEKIVGAGGTKLKHEDMEHAETGIDYLFIGRLDLEEQEETHPKTLSKAEWWANLFETPCVALAGKTIGAVEQAAATGADFVAIKDFVWNHSEGPAKAIAEANALLEQHTFEDVD